MIHGQSCPFIKISNGPRFFTVSESFQYLQKYSNLTQKQEHYQNYCKLYNCQSNM